jgi:2-keto-4-pentenoate hydratase/2-oxohepta-3-ene-1,7-dioic acid hydratase in catechol pathway
VKLFAYRTSAGQPTRADSASAGASFAALVGVDIALPPDVCVGLLDAEGWVDTPAGRRPLAELRPAPAVPMPSKIVCIGLNYRDHVEEQHAELPTRPLLFAKFANTVIADGEPIVRPSGTHALDLEAELGVVIGRRARDVRREDAMAHVLGYTVLDDVTARDWQGNKAALEPGERGDGQWLRAKGSDTFLPMGPVLVTADEIPDPSALRIRSWRIPSTGPHAGDEMPMQDGTTADMIFDIPTLIEFVSAVITLEPGDVISTGTPAGVGVFRDPPVFLEPGDRVRCEVERVGSVENTVIDRSDVRSGGREATRD